jgi:hypothetical protein
MSTKKPNEAIIWEGKSRNEILEIMPIIRELINISETMTIVNRIKDDENCELSIKLNIHRYDLFNFLSREGEKDGRK